MHVVLGIARQSGWQSPHARGGSQPTIAIVDAINAVEKDMKARFPDIRGSLFEPDVVD